MSETIDQIKLQLTNDILDLLKEAEPTKTVNAFQFIFLAYVEKIPFSDIAKSLSESPATLTKWNFKLKPVWQKLRDIRTIHKRKEISLENYWDFYLWHTTSKRQCQYCGITDEQIKILNPLVENKRKTRGPSMEIDRQISHEKYDNLKNLAWSCYWCNNAKTDTFSAEEFEGIGKAIGEVWKKRLKNDN